MTDSIWKSYSSTSLAAGLHLKVATVNIWVKSKNEEIWIASSYEDKTEPEGVTWARFAYPDATEEVTIKPVFPNLPVIISSEYSLRIASGSKIQIFTRIPVWVQISLGKSNYMLTEIPSAKLSRTWFGNPIEGELCWWQSTRARRNLDEVEASPFLINCPILIDNKTHADLNFEKFCYRVDRLSIFDVDGNLWADETLIEYHGEEQNSDVSMSGKLPSGMNKGILVTPPKNPISKSFATRTFKKLFDDTFSSDR